MGSFVLKGLPEGLQEEWETVVLERVTQKEVNYPDP